MGVLVFSFLIICLMRSTNIDDLSGLTSGQQKFSHYISALTPI